MQEGPQPSLCMLAPVFPWTNESTAPELQLLKGWKQLVLSLTVDVVRKQCQNYLSSPHLPWDWALEATWHRALALAKIAMVADVEIWDHSVTKTSPVKICWEQHLPCICITPSYVVNKLLQTLGIQSDLYHPQGHWARPVWQTGYFHDSRLWLLELGGPEVHPLQESKAEPYTTCLLLCFFFFFFGTETDHARCVISVQLVMVVHCCSEFSTLPAVDKCTQQRWWTLCGHDWKRLKPSS